MSKRETVEEFLSRGGKIVVCPPQSSPNDDPKVTPSTPGGGILSLTDGGLYYAEKKERAKKLKAPPSINVAALPASLLKFVPKS